MPLINKGANASKVLASQRHRPLQSASRAVDIVDELPKKLGCSLSTPAFDASPLHQRSNHKMTKRSATGRRHQDNTKGIVSKTRQDKTRPSYLVPPLDIILDLAATAGFEDRLMRSTSYRFAWEQRIASTGESVSACIYTNNEAPVLRRVESHVSIVFRLMQPWS